MRNLVFHPQGAFMRYIYVGLLVFLSAGCSSYISSYTPQPPLTHGRTIPRAIGIDYCGEGGA